MLGHTEFSAWERDEASSPQIVLLRVILPRKLVPTRICLCGAETDFGVLVEVENVECACLKLSSHAVENLPGDDACTCSGIYAHLQHDCNSAKFDGRAWNICSARFGLVNKILSCGQDCNSAILAMISAIEHLSNKWACQRRFLTQVCS